RQAKHEVKLQPIHADGARVLRGDSIMGFTPAPFDGVADSLTHAVERRGKRLVARPSQSGNKGQLQTIRPQARQSHRLARIGSRIKDMNTTGMGTNGGKL